MKVEIEVTEVPEDTIYFHQSGFSLNGEDGKAAVEFNTTVPGGAPYIFIHEGPNKGKRFEIPLETLKGICMKLYNGENVEDKTD